MIDPLLYILQGPRPWEPSSPFSQFPLHSASFQNSFLMSPHTGLFPLTSQVPNFLSSEPHAFPPAYLLPLRLFLLPSTLPGIPSLLHVQPRAWWPASDSSLCPSSSILWLSTQDNLPSVIWLAFYHSKWHFFPPALLR